MRKVYVTLQFRDRPDLHMTLRYYGERTEEQIADLIEELEVNVTEELSAQSFPMFLDHPQLFGWKTKVRALVPSTPLPLWVYRFVADEKHWRAHVVCDDDRLWVHANAVALMCKNEEIRRWELT